MARFSVREQRPGQCQSEMVGCHCELDAGHEGTHACRCGGEWTDNCTPVVMPQYVVEEGVMEFRMLEAAE